MSDKAPVVLSNGTLVDPETHRFMPGGRPSTAIRTREQASAMAKRRHELAGIAARKALADAAAEHGHQRSSVAAVGLLVKRSYEASLTGYEGDKVVNADGSEWYRVDRRGATEAAKFSLKLAGYGAEEQRGSGSMVNVQVNVSPELLRAWEKRIAGAEIVDSEAQDVAASDIEVDDTSDEEEGE